MDTKLYLVISAHLELELYCLFQAFEAPRCEEFSYYERSSTLDDRTSPPYLAPLLVAPETHL